MDVQMTSAAYESLSSLFWRAMADLKLTHEQLLLRISHLKTNLLREINNPGTVAGFPALYGYRELHSIVDSTAAVHEMTRLEMFALLTDLERTVVQPALMLEKSGQATSPVIKQRGGQ